MTYSVDLEHLTSTLERLTLLDQRLEVVFGDVHARLLALHQSWSGQAASAAESAERTWDAGFDSMRESLATMHRAGANAHANYSEAVRLNTGMWEQLR